MSPNRRVITYDAIVAGATEAIPARRHDRHGGASARARRQPRDALPRGRRARPPARGCPLEPGGADVRASAGEVRSRGVDAILEISDRFTETLTAAGPFRRFLECEPQTALRVLLTPAGGVHERAVALQREIFAEAFRGREDEVGGDLDTLAYLYVRLRESILYADIMSGRYPDPEVARRAVRALLASG